MCSQHKLLLQEQKFLKQAKKSKQKRRNYSLKQNGSKKHSESSRYEEFTVQLLYCWIVSEMHQKVKQVDMYLSCYIVKELAPLEHKQYGISRRSMNIFSSF